MLAQSMINIVEMKRIENHNKFQLKMKKITEKQEIWILSSQSLFHKIIERIKILTIDFKDGDANSWILKDKIRTKNIEARAQRPRRAQNSGKTMLHQDNRRIPPQHSLCFPARPYLVNSFSVEVI
jgi:hypothetical protein